MYKVKHESLTQAWADELVSSLLRRSLGLNTSLAEVKQNPQTQTPVPRSATTRLQHFSPELPHWK